MKFDKVLNQTKKLFHDITLQNSTLPYKFWKKYIKQNKHNFNHNDIYLKLNKQCHQVDKVFYHELKYPMYPPFSCFKPKVYSETLLTDLIQFSEINRTALYKICKKLEKNGASNLLNYYTYAKSKQLYKFMGTHELTYLKFQQDPSLVECPICMEDEESSMVIFDCEHSVCLECLIKMTHIKEKKGTLYNRLLASSFSCPICRTIKPLKEVTRYHFYPTPPKNILV